jgi:hypothetical protein
MKQESCNSYKVSRSALNIIVLLLTVNLLSACGEKPTSSSSSGAVFGHPTISNTDSTPRNGRYAIVINPNIRADTFLLDTQKGKIWQLTKFTDLAGEPTGWNEMTIVDNGGDNSEKIPGSGTIYDYINQQTKKGETKKK